jgi:hypothetical protein
MLIKKGRSGVIRQETCFEVKYTVCLTLSVFFSIMT